MKKVNTLSSLSTRMLMVGCLFSGSLAFSGATEALTLSVAGGAGGKPGAVASVPVESVSIRGIPGVAELKIPGEWVDKFVALRARAKTSTGQDFGELLLTNPAYTVTVFGPNNQRYVPKLNPNASPTAAASEWITLLPTK